MLFLFMRVMYCHMEFLQLILGNFINIWVNLSGSDITNYLLDLLIENGLTFSRQYDRHIIKDIKEKKCYISENFEEETTEFKTNANIKEIVYELPDKQTINIGKLINYIRKSTNSGTRNIIPTFVNWQKK